MPSSFSFASAPIGLLLHRYRGSPSAASVSPPARGNKRYRGFRERVTMPSMTSSPPPARPVTPSPAATLVLLRDGADGAVEVLLLQRHGKSKFAAGDYVFAGGKVEAEDIPDDVERHCRALTAEEAASRLGDGLAGREALAYWVGAIREAFEEAGILLAYTEDGTFVRFTTEN